MWERHADCFVFRKNKLPKEVIDDLKKRYRRYPLWTAKRHVATKGVTDKLAFYFLRSALPDPMAGERRLLTKNREHSEQVARLATTLRT